MNKFYQIKRNLSSLILFILKLRKRNSTNESILERKTNILKEIINNTIKTFKTISKKKIDSSNLNAINKK